MGISPQIHTEILLRILHNTYSWKSFETLQGFTSKLTSYPDFFPEFNPRSIPECLQVFFSDCLQGFLQGFPRKFVFGLLLRKPGICFMDSSGIIAGPSEISPGIPGKIIPGNPPRFTLRIPPGILVIGMLTRISPGFLYSRDWPRGFTWDSSPDSSRHSS